MPELFVTPALDLEDAQVVASIEALRAALTGSIRVPRRWTGGLRRSAQARAIQGSNSIEGYVVTNEDALAALDDDEPMSADERTWAEILGYRRVLTYVLQVAADPTFPLDAPTLCAMHFMLLEHDLGKSPGRYRSSEIYVEREGSGERVYRGPDPARVTQLVEALASSLNASADLGATLVTGAMAHLNLVMIHPFRDGSGRMARALQTAVLASGGLAEPIFASIEEWLGHNTGDYYDVLALTGAGAWNPERDAHVWVKFCLRAHHMQAQTSLRRIEEADAIGREVEQVVAAAGLPERAFDPLFDAARGLRVRRSGYVKRSGVEERTASRDLKALVDAGLLAAQGNTRSRSYVGAGDVRELARAARDRRAALDDPYPWLIAQIRQELATMDRERPLA